MSASATLGTPPPPLFHQPSPSSRPQPITSPRTPPISTSTTQDSIHPETAMADDGDPMDLNMSTILQPPPQAQNHDRQNGDTLPAATQPGPSNAEEDEWEDEDVMDTTPDHSPAPQAPPVDSTPSSPHTPPHSDASNGAHTLTPAEQHDPNSQDSEVEADESDGSSSEDDYDDEWLAILEDHSGPDEDELKEIEREEEHSALDTDHFTTILKKDIPFEPEYDYAESGRINWLIDKFAGTKENPNREILMRSPTIKVGQYEFQIKLYPKGNATDYVSVYVECLDFAPQDDGGKHPKTKSRRNSGRDSGSSTKLLQSKLPSKPLHTPLPLLDSTKVEQRPSVAAHVLVVLYNPEEPRVFRHRLAHHRFCPNSFDWGWTRFHGPYFEIGQRQRGERAALLKHDKIALTAFIQLIDDKTGCLYEHVGGENPWDSFAMTGIQPMVGDSRTPHAMVAALSSWLLFRPFRQFLYDVPVPDPDYDHHEKPRQMVTALKMLLANLRTLMPVERRARARPPVDLEPIRLALDFYGIDEVILKCDVIEVWEVIRAKIEEELAGTPYSHRMTEIFGAEKDRRTDLATYRVPVKGVESIQDAVALNPDLIPKTAESPQLLHIELERQDFEPATRSWQKLRDKVKLDDVLELPGRNEDDTQFYTLYGFITHDKDLQTPSYKAVIRPNGPGSAWYQFMDCRNSYELWETKLVQRLTEREAVDAHEGAKPKAANQVDPCLAYIALYVLDDFKEYSFDTAQTEEWDPGWIKAYVDQVVKSIPAEKGKSPMDIAGNPEEEDSHFDGTFQVKAVSSSAFKTWSDAGIINLWHPDLEMTEGFLSFTIKGNATVKDVQRKIATTALQRKIDTMALQKNLGPDDSSIKDPRLVKFWALEPRDGQFLAPCFVRDDTKDEYPFGSTPERTDNRKVAQRWIWYHVMDESYLDVLKKEAKKAAPVSPAAGSSATAASSSALPPPDFLSRSNMSEDVLMSDNMNGLMPIGSTNNLPPPPPGSNPLPPPPNANISIPPRRSHLLSGAYIGGPTSTTSSANHLPIPPPPSFTNPLIPPPGLSSIPPPALLDPISRPWQHYMQSNPENPDIYIFVKVWDVWTQTLKGIGTFWAKYKDRVDNTIYKIFKATKEPPVPMWFEKGLSSIEPIKRRKTFAELGLRPGTIIIAQLKPFGTEDDEATNITEAGGFVDLEKYLIARSKDVAYPARAELDVTYTLNYYGQEYYVGSLYKHESTGLKSTKIYFNGNQYRGAMAMGQRSGAGSIVYCNGDTYTGMWRRDMQHGLGTFTDSSSGNVYEGGWQAGRRHGQGTTHWERAQEGPNECRICYERNADAALVDCGHVCACIACARRLDACPLCRRKVLSALKLWYGS